MSGPTKTPATQPIEAAIEPNKLQGQAPAQRAVYPQVRRATMVCKNHLDIGFTESAAKVVHDQINWMMPGAVAQAARLRDEGFPFCWTVASYLVWEALERRTGDARAVIERGVNEGALAWLATPFTTHTELMDAELFEFGLSLSQRLDARFGKKTIAGKMTDVPGHTRGIIPLLAKAGVKFFHIGVNHMSAMPEVPRMFRWRDPDTGAEVVVAYHNDYGGDYRPEGHPHALLFRMIGDNMEVPSPADVREWYRTAREAHPNAEVSFGRIDDFAATIDPLVPGLPVVDREIGDTWIYGGGTDPLKVAQYRELLRRRKEWLRAGKLLPDSKAYVDFSKNLSLVAEHTWSVSFGPHLPDRVSWANADFERVRHRGPFRTLEASWQEQRDYVEYAVEALRGASVRLADEANAALAALAPRRPRLDEWTLLTPEKAGAADAPVRVDAKTGAVIGWRSAKGNVEAVATGGLGRFAYQTFSVEHLDEFRLDYCGKGAMWAGVDFGKPGLQPGQSELRWWEQQVMGLWSRDEGRRVLVQLASPAEAHLRYGAPREVWVEVEASADGKALTWTLTWIDKTTTRLPEALWMSFVPKVKDPTAWRLLKMDRRIDPAEVVSRGGRTLHATDGAVYSKEDDVALTFETLDAPLIAPGKPALATFKNEIPDMAGGLHVNLFNNLWGTNFPGWNGDDARFRFRLSVG